MRRPIFYALTAPEGARVRSRIPARVNAEAMLALGVFGGK